MTDTIQKIADEMTDRASKLRREAGDGDHLLQVIGREVAETVNGWAGRLTALSARASAGEGGEYVLVPREPTDEMLRVWLTHQEAAGGRTGGDMYPWMRALRRYQKMLTAAPQPAQAGASGGGDVPDDVAERCRTYDSARLLQCALEVYARSCMYNTEAQHNAAMAYRDELLRRLTPASVEPREAFAWMKAGPSGTPLLHTVTQNIKIREEWEANGWVSIPIFLPTPPAHGDGEGVNPHFWIQAIRTNAHVTDCKEKTQALLNAADALATYLTTRPTPEARDAARWRALIGSARIRVLGSAGLLTDTRPDGEPWNGYAHIGLELWTQHEAGNEPADAVEWLTKYTDAALALPAQGEGS